MAVPDEAPAHHGAWAPRCHSRPRSPRSTQMPQRRDVRSLLVFISDRPLSPSSSIQRKSGACLWSGLRQTGMSADGGTNTGRLKMYLTVRNAVLRKKGKKMSKKKLQIEAQMRRSQGQVLPCSLKWDVRVWQRGEKINLIRFISYYLSGNKVLERTRPL